ncbi:TraB/GumN family protein [Qipengyuania flava]|uniref:TraB/GumN family protein n=1 Tax=Qipengyuania flava TaxID=192812 RepID=UPI001C62761F|nr:TraB/GumN family protein [Qipengyuania flava]QYJ06017.1 TraB/GumN family protein [Qipengyuania flava]
MSRRFLPALCASLALLLASCSQQPDTAKPEGPYPALWEISDGNGAVEGWMFGTIHALPDDTKWRSPQLDTVLGEADMLVVEVANLEDGAELSRLFEQMAFDRPAGPIVDRIDPNLRSEFEALLVKAKVRRTYFDPMESWAAALALAQVAQSAKSENGADRALLAEFDKREVVELEGARGQLAIFDSLPEAEQRDLLNAVLEESRDYEGEIGTLAQAWLEGDTDRLSQLTRRGILADPELEEALLTRRNSDWAAQVENLLSAQDRPLIAVGAGHLLGDEGLPAKLEARGYAIRRIE